MDRKKFVSILTKSQKTTACHQRNIQLLSQLYEESSFEDFFPHLMNSLDIVFHSEITAHNPYAERTLDFLAKFCAEIYKKNVDEQHEFLSKTVTEVLDYNDLIYVQARFHSCHFITLLLKHIGDEVTLDNDLCDFIQEAMLNRIVDPKMNIRLEAITTLIRLQDPQNCDCPVINAYLNALADSKATIRREVMKNIAPNALTLPRILEKTRDVHASVRSMAFSRCADIGPKHFNIEDRQTILKNGFGDDDVEVRNVFHKQLLPKWLTAYNGDFLGFLKGLKLDADEDDIENTMEISRSVMKFFFKKYPVSYFLAVLELNQSKQIPQENLTTDSALYLNILVSFLRENEDFFDDLQKILPELTPFCHYIEQVMNFWMQDNLDQWKYFDLQTILFNLFDIVDGYDLSDEVGRRTLQNLLPEFLQKYKFDRRLTKKLISIFHKCSTNVDLFTSNVCEIISNIREPFIEMPLTQELTRQRDIEIAEIRVKLNVLNGEKEDALETQDSQKASIVQNEITSLSKKLENIDDKYNNEKVRAKKDDDETICRCLDILISLLNLKAIEKMTPALTISKDDFVLPLIGSQNGEIHWRILNCLVLFAIIDENTAREYANVICIPVATYRIIPNYNKMALVKSIHGISDLLRIYGPDLLWKDNQENSSTASNNTNNDTKKRKLYDRNEEMSPPQNPLNLEFFMDILLDILDDECTIIKHCALDALAKLIFDGLFISALLISRIVLKWYNPVSGNKQKDNFQAKLGILIEKYAMFKESREIFENALIPTLTSIIDAPKTSPLYDVSIENVVQFFAAMLNAKRNEGIVNVNNKTAITLCLKIAEDKTHRLVPFLAKTILHLDCRLDDSALSKELLRLIELLQKEIKDKNVLRYIDKFVKKIKEISINNTTSNTTTENTNNMEVTQNTNGEITESTTNMEVTQNTNGEMPQSANEERQEKNTSVQVKRRKRRGRNGKLKTKTVSRRNSSDSNNSTELHTINENSLEMDNLTIDDSSDTEKIRKSITIITETSSDTESDNSGKVRRSRRMAKSKKT